jgi:hypothetical protein
MDLQGLNFSPAVGVQAAIKAHFGEPVSSSSPGRHDFILLASFGRCKFRLSEHSVGFLKQPLVVLRLILDRSKSLKGFSSLW